jgi:acyl CoA:acetate/3-ketoacid CoA transferase
VKEGFQVREDYWGGDLGSGEKKAVRQQLFKGNEYWFWLGTEVERAKISVHIYDSDGKLAEEQDGWQKGHFAAAHVVPKTTGSYFVIVNIEESPEERTHWALVYGFR